MHRTTLVLATISILLAGGIATVAWHIWAAPAEVSGSVEGASVALGIPDVRPEDQKQEIPAESALVWNTATKSIVVEQNGFERRPIASLTKLMTAMVALDYGVTWEDEVEILPAEYVIGGQLLLHPGERVTMRDLFNASLLGSANNATLAYVRALGVPEEEFIQAMNRKAVELELEQTVFTDVTGLDKKNISTAYEVARLAEHAFTQYPDIGHITSQKEYTFQVRGSDRSHTIRNTNKLISDGGLNVRGSKTGYLYEAGYCLVAAGSGAHQDLVAVVLDSPSEPHQYQGIVALFAKVAE